MSQASGLVSGILSQGLTNIFGVSQKIIPGNRRPHDFKNIILYFVGGVSPSDIRDAFEQFHMSSKDNGIKTLFVGGSKLLEQGETTRNLLDWNRKTGP